MSNPRDRRGRGKKRRREETNNSTIDLPNGKKHRRLCDETQSQADRRALRVQYRNLHETTAEQRAEIVDVTSGRFQGMMREQDNLFDNVSYPSEAFLDVQQSKQMAGCLVEQTQDLANAQFTFSANDIIEAVQNKFRDEDGRINWARIGEEAAPFFRTVPRVRIMNGKMQKEVQDAPVKVRRQYKKKVEKDEGPVTQPAILKAKDIKDRDKTETKSRIQKLKKTLRTRDADSETRESNIFELLVNPQSYSETVENFFDMSFLCRQGFSQLEVDDETNQPIITYVSSEANKLRRKQEDSVSNSQCIVRLDPSMFMDVVDTYQLSESQIERDVSMSVPAGSDNDDDDGDLDEMLGGGQAPIPKPQRKRPKREPTGRTSGSRRVVRGKRQLDSDTDADSE